MAKATDKNSYDEAELKALGDRLIAHADTITNAARRDIANDLREAAKIVHSLTRAGVYVEFTRKSSGDGQ